MSLSRIIYVMYALSEEKSNFLGKKSLSTLLVVSRSIKSRESF